MCAERASALSGVSHKGDMSCLPERKNGQNSGEGAEEKAEDLSETVFVVTCGNRFLITRRQEQGLLAGLYEFPNTEGTLSGEEALSYLGIRKEEKKRVFDGAASAGKTHFYPCGMAYDRLSHCAFRK